MRGEPMKPATNRLAGLSYSSIGVPTCSIAARLQHHDAVGHGHGFDLVVRHVDHGRAAVLVQPPSSHAHLPAQRRVEVRQRLVEEEHFGLAHDGPADGDPLALPARELSGLRSRSSPGCRICAAASHLLRRRSALGTPAA